MHMSVRRHVMSTSSRDFGKSVETFLLGLRIASPLPNGIEVLQPYSDREVRRVVREMCATFYTDEPQRIALWGINPGRFGAGLTGLSFTDPYALRNDLGIDSTIDGRREISAEFVYRVIDAYGGPSTFYRDVYMSALSPLGFVRGTTNLNFYDDVELQDALTPQIQRWTKKQISFGLRSDVTVVLGTGKLKHYMEQHVKAQCGFSKVLYLEHPRFIMQYRRKSVEDYVRKYVETIRGLVSSA